MRYTVEGLERLPVVVFLIYLAVPQLFVIAGSDRVMLCGTVSSCQSAAATENDKYYTADNQTDQTDLRKGPFALCGLTT